MWRELLTILGVDTQTCGNWILDIYVSLNSAKIQWIKVGCQVSIHDERWLRLTCQLLEHAYLKQTELLQKSFTEVHLKRVKLINCYEFFAFRAAKQRHILLKSVLFKNFLQ